MTFKNSSALLFACCFARFGAMFGRSVHSLAVSGAIVFVLLFIVGLPSVAFATAGKLNDAGCHNSQKIGYHCHAERLPRGAGSESVRERDSRLKRECWGRPNSGLCLGYAR